jgi:purine-binding chemotaxis protein CheW
MDLADIRKKANIQKNTGFDGVREAERSLPSIQGTPLEGPVAMPPDGAVVGAKNVRIETSRDAIKELFDHPYRIDRIEEIDRQDFAKIELEKKGNYRQWLTFSLCDEEYAIDIESVNEIIKPRDVTDIPRVPGFVLGIISLRGIIVPIYDLARRLDFGQIDIDSQSRVIVCQIEEKMVGLLVDSITQVVRINEKKIEPPPAVLSGVNREFVAGVGRYQGRMLILLQLQNVLNPEIVLPRGKE